MMRDGKTARAAAAKLVPNATTVAFLDQYRKQPEPPLARANTRRSRRAPVGSNSSSSALQLTPERLRAGLFDAGAAAREGGLVVAPDPFLDSQRERLVELAATHRSPRYIQWREFVQPEA